MTHTCIRPARRLPRGLIAALATLAAAVAHAALAHATLVLGTLHTEPAPPQPGQPFTLVLDLVDPTQAPVEDAIVIAEFRPQDGGEMVSVRFTEIRPAGRYQAEASLPQGTYQLLLRDQTFRQEEARAELQFEVPGDGEPISFIFPPTATGPGNRGLARWLIWLIGVPVVAAIVVTIAVLTSSRNDDAEADDASA